MGIPPKLLDFVWQFDPFFLITFRFEVSFHVDDYGLHLVLALFSGGNVKYDVGRPPVEHQETVVEQRKGGTAEQPESAAAEWQLQTGQQAQQQRKARHVVRQRRRRRDQGASCTRSARRRKKKKWKKSARGKKKKTLLKRRCGRRKARSGQQEETGEGEKRERTDTRRREAEKRVLRKSTDFLRRINAPVMEWEESLSRMFAHIATVSLGRLNLVRLVGVHGARMPQQTERRSIATGVRFVEATTNGAIQDTGGAARCECQ